MPAQPAVGASLHPTLTVGGFCKAYGRLAALDDVGFTVRPGEVLGLIGPNGAGKTTLFECLAGVLPPSAGAITVDGRPLTTRERLDLVFYVPDAIAPWSSQTVRWVIDFTLGFFDGRADLRDEVIRDLSLTPLLDSRMRALSKGQRKRALLAIGLLTRPPILLVDEPFDGLDLRQSRDVASTLRAQAARGRTLVLSIHQIPDAARICDRFVLLSAGRVRGEGTLEELAALASTQPDTPASAANLEEVFLALT